MIEFAGTEVAPDGKRYTVGAPQFTAPVADPPTPIRVKGIKVEGAVVAINSDGEPEWTPAGGAGPMVVLSTIGSVITSINSAQISWGGGDHPFDAEYEYINSDGSQDTTSNPTFFDWLDMTDPASPLLDEGIYALHGIVSLAYGSPLLTTATWLYVTAEVTGSSPSNGVAMRPVLASASVQAASYDVDTIVATVASSGTHVPWLHADKVISSEHFGTSHFTGSLAITKLA